MYVSAGPAPLLDGAPESVVATCVAERGRPAASVSWESPLDGRSEPATQDEANGTATVQAHYVWRPQSHAQGQSLTCVVRHPALTTDFRIPFALSVQCEYLLVHRPPLRPVHLEEEGLHDVNKGPAGQLPPVWEGDSGPRSEGSLRTPAAPCCHAVSDNPVRVLLVNGGG